MKARRRLPGFFPTGILGLLICLVPVYGVGGEFDDIPVKGMPTLVVLGTPACPPCIRMKPILEEMAKRYSGKAAVVPIDIATHQDQAERFKVKAIPLAIFFNHDGREMLRHLGFMDTETIQKQFKKMGLE